MNENQEEVEVAVDDTQEVVEEPQLTDEQKQSMMLRASIVTPQDQERWPILEMESKVCATPISEDDENMIVFMDDVLNELDEEAAGLAAIQVGYPKRIFLLRNGVNADGEAFNNAYINPTILFQSKDSKRGSEACLSLPGMGITHNRPKSVTLQYFDLSGELHNQTFTGFWAKAVAHEMDHLEGVMINQHLEKQLGKQSNRTKFGMKLTPQRRKAIAKRRKKKGQK